MTPDAETAGHGGHPEPADQIRYRRRRGSAGGRPVDFDPANYRRRNVLEQAFDQLEQWR